MKQRYLLWLPGALVLLLVSCRRTEAPEKQQDASLGEASVVASAALPGPLEAVMWLTPPASEDAKAASLVTTKDAAFLVWIEPSKNGVSQGGRVRISRYAERAWSEPSTVVDKERLLVNWADVPALSINGRQVVVTWTELVGEGMHLLAARSMDEGKSFTPLGPIHEGRAEVERGFTTILPAGNGFRLFWLDGKVSAPMRLATASLGERITQENILDERVCDCCSIAATESAEATLVAYRDRSVDEIRDIAIGRFLSTEKPLFASNLLHADGFRVSGCPVNGPALWSEKDGKRVIVAWYTYPKEQARVRIGFSEDGGRSFGAPFDLQAPSPGEAEVGRVALVGGSDGSAIVSRIVADRERARLVVVRVLREGRASEPLILSTMRADRASGFPKMARLGDNLLIATNIGDPPRLRVALLPENKVPMASPGDTIPQQNPSEQAGLKIGDKPAFLGTTLDGKPTSLAALRGKPVLLNLWATYCEPCRQELPWLSALDKKYRTRGLTIVGIAMDQEKSPAEVRRFIEKRGVSYPIWIDPDDRAGRALLVRVLPATILLDGEGKVVFVRRGALVEGDIEISRAIEQVLGKTR